MMQTEHDTPCNSQDILDVLNNLYPGIKLNNKAMGILLDIAKRTLQRLCIELKSLMSNKNSNLIQTSDVEFAVKIRFARGLYRSASSKMKRSVEDELGVKLSCTRVHHSLKREMPNYRFGKKAVIAVTAAIEFMIAEIIGCSAALLRDNSNDSHIAPIHIHESIGFDEELSLFYNETVYDIYMRYYSLTPRGAVLGDQPLYPTIGRLNQEIADLLEERNRIDQRLHALHAQLDVKKAEKRNEPYEYI
jgi:histone H3/H4